jgi:hypothetical protein
MLINGSMSAGPVSAVEVLLGLFLLLSVTTTRPVSTCKVPFQREPAIVVLFERRPTNEWVKREWRKHTEIVKENVAVAICRQNPKRCGSCLSKTKNKHYGKHVVTSKVYGQSQPKNYISSIRQELHKYGKIPK